MTNKEIAQHICEGLYGNGDTSLVDRYFAEDFVSHDPVPGFPADREGVRNHVEAIHGAMDVEQSEATHLLAEGDDVAVHWRITGTHTGEYIGIPATNRRVDTNGIVIYRFRDGKVVEEWQRSDDLGMMQQLGVLPDEFGAPA